MNTLITKIKSLVAHLLAYVPTRLPIGMAEFDTWAKSVISLTKLPDNDSTRFALASTVPHQKAEKFLSPKIKYAWLLEKSAANQVAFGVMTELKEKQQRLAAEEAAKQAEATAQDGPSGEQSND